MRALRPLVFRLLNSVTFRSPFGEQFYVAEVEVYLNTDPYTHGHSNQIIKESNYFYFHRASKNPKAKYRGGTFKGVDLTIGNYGGGILIRSIETEEGFIEGPCKVVEHLLKIFRVQTIDEFINLYGTDANKFMFKDPDRECEIILKGPRFGLRNKENSISKSLTFNEPLRFVRDSFFKKIRKNKKSITGFL
jgi:hypothetical protein